MVESIGAISLLGRVPVYGVCYGKDLSSKRKAIDVCGMPSADFRGRKVVCGSYLRRLRADCVRRLDGVLTGNSMRIIGTFLWGREDILLLSIRCHRSLNFIQVIELTGSHPKVLIKGKTSEAIAKLTNLTHETTTLLQFDDEGNVVKEDSQLI
ncbi:hypothetical protein CQW23_00097 [Capsicum baccatum]|uniref:Uncharacterized protein n=1 Tax=Capsicum baccatum TaxID=33114 RepID=A0A2G2XJQ3_CAPBA|nr:hypothetical protein CQW23_00097 [Capsicum baccatum]